MLKMRIHKLKGQALRYGFDSKVVSKHFSIDTLCITRGFDTMDGAALLESTILFQIADQQLVIRDFFKAKSFI